MGKSKNRKPVHSMTMEQLETELKNASGTRKNILLREIQRRKG
ncbi:hypothetical protein [Vibrio phage RYC]|nr:hypothetical protein [Vibrio phage RYC]